ncbi:hypothetical protein M422DRAFT_776790 [Sphaerobolus stellatus SS14]|nr:hypothetical protein M422DRAFT_776790 [Sphaerobolus stellatus SS14]
MPYRSTLPLNFGVLLRDLYAWIATKYSGNAIVKDSNTVVKEILQEIVDSSQRPDFLSNHDLSLVFDLQFGKHGRPYPWVMNELKTATYEKEVALLSYVFNVSAQIMQSCGLGQVGPTPNKLHMEHALLLAAYSCSPHARSKLASFIESLNNSSLQGDTHELSYDSPFPPGAKKNSSSPAVPLSGTTMSPSSPSTPLTGEISNSSSPSTIHAEDLTDCRYYDKLLKIQRNHKIAVGITARIQGEVHRYNIAGTADWVFHRADDEGDIRGVGIYNTGFPHLLTYLAIIRRRRQVEGRPMVDLIGFHADSDYIFSIVSIREDGTVWESKTMSGIVDGEGSMISRFLCHLLHGNKFSYPIPPKEGYLISDHVVLGPFSEKKLLILPSRQY